MKKLFKNGVIITANAQGDWYKQGYLIIEGNTIIEVGSGEPELAAAGQEYDQVIDLQGNWLMPGWVNTHGHTGMSFLRGYADDLPLKEWLETKMWPMEAQFTSETVKWASALSIVEMLKSGTTCFVDMYDHMHMVAPLVEESGIRGVLSRGVIGLCSEEEQQQKLREASLFAQDWHGKADGRITTMLAPHAPYTCPPAYIEKIVEKAAELNLPIHTHMSETAAEVEQNVTDYGKRPVQHLLDLGLFERPTLVAHAVHLNEEEIEILIKHDVKISHNPASNLKLGSGIAPVIQLLEKGAHVAIGTDSVASNNNLDMFQEVRLSALIHKGAFQSPTAVPAQTALQMGTSWGAEAVFLHNIGALEAGKEADFIVINANQAHLQPLHDPISHIIYSASGQDVQDVYVQGKAVVQNKECISLDEERILYEANKLFQALNKV